MDDSDWRGGSRWRRRRPGDRRRRGHHAVVEEFAASTARGCRPAGAGQIDSDESPARGGEGDVTSAVLPSARWERGEGGRDNHGGLYAGPAGRPWLCAGPSSTTSTPRLTGGTNLTGRDIPTITVRSGHDPQREDRESSWNFSDRRRPHLHPCRARPAPDDGRRGSELVPVTRSKRGRRGLPAGYRLLLAFVTGAGGVLSRDEIGVDKLVVNSRTSSSRRLRRHLEAPPSTERPGLAAFSSAPAVEPAQRTASRRRKAQPIGTCRSRPRVRVDGSRN